MGRWGLLLCGGVMTLGTACGSDSSARASEDDGTSSAAPAAEPAASVSGSEEGVCLPIVHGCGCTYGCAESLRINQDGTHEVVGHFTDSATVNARLERWCEITDTGLLGPAADRTDMPCHDVFYDRSSCGGECIPTREHLTCHRTVEGCRP